MPEVVSRCPEDRKVFDISMTEQQFRNELRSKIDDALLTFKVSLEEIAELELLKRKEVLSEKEVERLFGIPCSTLRTKRSRGIGPAYIKDGSSVYYKPSAVRGYLDARKVKTYDQR